MAKSKARAEATPPALPITLTYLADSRRFATGFLFILPLLVGYELGIVLLHSDVINWAHGMVRLIFRTFGPAEPFVFAGLIAALVVAALMRTDTMRLDLELFGLMFAESLVFAFGLWLGCSLAAQRLFLAGTPASGRGLLCNLVLSAGAGVYEEVLFRVVLLGSIYCVLKSWCKVRPGLSAFYALVSSSLVFAACHHIGPYGEPLELAPVVYRFGLGVLFAAIYIYRGLGIVVYTHTLYDVFCSLSR